MLKELEGHEVACVYRNIICPFVICYRNKNISFIGLGHHLEANHEDLKKVGKSKSKGVISAKKPATNMWIPQQLTFRNRSFFTEVMGSIASKFRFFWIYFHGTPEEATHYSYRLKIIGENELIFKGKVISLDMMKDYMNAIVLEANPDVLILYDVQVGHLQVDGQINFEITLYSDKEEIKNEDVESGISDDDEQ
jgi:hypothetical protein